MKKIINNLSPKVVKDLTHKTRELSTEGIDYLRKTPIHKIAAGTAIVVIPGALTALAAYAVGKKIVKSYQAFKAEETNKDVNFINWFTDSSKEQIGKNINIIRSKSNMYIGKANKESDLPKLPK